MATSSLVGGAQKTLTAPEPDATGQISSFVGGAQIALVAPGGPYRSSFVGGGRATLAPPTAANRSVKVKIDGVWTRAIIEVFDDDTLTWL